MKQEIPSTTRDRECPKCKSKNIKYIGTYQNKDLKLRKSISSKDGYEPPEKPFLYNCEDCNIEFVLIKR